MWLLALLRRLFSAAIALVVVGVLTYGLIRWLRPEQYRGQPLLSSTWHDLQRVFLHFDFGPGCSANPSCLPVRLYWDRGWVADVTLLAGGLLIGAGAGVGL